MQFDALSMRGRDVVCTKRGTKLMLSYICRQDVQDLGYSHFCQHFRPLGGPCRSCTNCGLYDKEDEEEAVKEARVRATREYLTRHPSCKLHGPLC